MTASTFNIGLSALRAFQQGLATTGHNIANVNTEGFSRQRVTFESREPQFIGIGFVGKGVDTQGIRRIANQFLIDQLRSTTSSQVNAAMMTDLIDQVDRQIGNGLVADSMASFFNALNDANDDPRLMATRQVLMENARAMVARFAEQEDLLNGLSRSVNQQITGKIAEINTFTEAIAAINIDIARSAGLAQGEAPSDLLDMRDKMLLDLSRLIGITTQPGNDGMINVLAGSGNLLVTGGTQVKLRAIPNSLDASRIEVAYDVAGTLAQITSSVDGGELGALIEFRDAVLEPTRNAIGRLAVGIALSVNKQHREGMDLNGALGGDLFSLPAPNVNSLATNVGSISVVFDQNDVGGLTTSDYRLRHDGTDFILTRLSDNSMQTLSGAGPFDVDGITISITGAPAAGDEYLINPTKLVPRAMRLATIDPAELALALPIRTQSEFANLGDAIVSIGEILDPTDPSLLATTQIVFNDPPTTYQINGAGPLLAYTSGGNIDVNGWRIQVTGAPVAGDVFTIESNAGGIGDNGNGLVLSRLQFTPILQGGTASYQEAYGILIGEVGSAAQQSRISRDALSALQENAQIARDGLSGVNLDEEAANLLRFQQAYQAAAQIIIAANEAFETLLAAVRR
ncbi:MAG: flagellar hook-associated protein FlgK [Gammaproteobacteria bacterium]|nr:flagellar hook-associated protein FlgK [Gammaproteobacteria bacterium]